MPTPLFNHPYFSSLHFGTLQATFGQNPVNPQFVPVLTYNNQTDNRMQNIALNVGVSSTLGHRIAAADGELLGYTVNYISATHSGNVNSTLRDCQMFVGIGVMQPDGNYKYFLSGGLCTTGVVFETDNDAVPDPDNLVDLVKSDSYFEQGQEWFGIPYDQWGGTDSNNQYRSHTIKFNRGDIIICGVTRGIDIVSEESFSLSGSFSIDAHVQYEDYSN